MLLRHHVLPSVVVTEQLSAAVSLWSVEVVVDSVVAPRPH